jgi:hypothetical protein
MGHTLQKSAPWQWFTSPISMLFPMNLHFWEDFHGFPIAMFDCRMVSINIQHRRHESPRHWEAISWVVPELASYVKTSARYPMKGTCWEGNQWKQLKHIKTNPWRARFFEIIYIYLFVISYFSYFFLFFLFFHFFLVFLIFPYVLVVVFMRNYFIFKNIFMFWY